MLSPQALATIEDILAAPENGPAQAARLRQAIPGLRVTVCDASDVGTETPFRDYPSVALHLVDSSAHCWHLTTEPDLASVVLLAYKGR
jgi:hypothetical protein